MEIEKLRKNLYGLTTKTQSYLNDTYLWVNVSRKAILAMPGDKLSFDVPKAKSASANRTVNRNNRDEVIERITNQDIYYSAYVSIISRIEDHLSKIIQMLLDFDNSRIKVTISDVNMNANISVIDFIDNSREDLIEELINQRINRFVLCFSQKAVRVYD